MKIEIAENLVYSYLKHVEGCRVVQTNWKTSNQWIITEYEEKQARELFDRVKSSSIFNGIFKNSSFEQLIKQAEIDVIGLNTIEKSVFAIDVAFHSAGLNYGSTEETALRIFKKIFRTVFIMQTYFADYDKFNSFFVTPKANPATEKTIRELIEQANEIIADDMISIDFIANVSFYSFIIDSTLENLDEDNDTSELFLRSVKLMQLDKRVSISRFPKEISEKKSIVNNLKREVDGMKIGQFVQYTMRKFHEQNLIPKSEIENLQDKSYSKTVFDQTFEILRSPDREIQDAEGRNRYYTKEKFCGNYYLTSQWVEKHWEPFLRWVEKFQ